MNRPLIEALDRMVEKYRRNGRLVLLFDYDGTLTPFADRPDRALLPSETREWLVRLTSSPRVDVGIVSGRSLEDLGSMMRLHGIYLAGTSGIELDLRGERIDLPQVGFGGASLRAVIPALRAELTAFEGAWVEPKPLGLTVHFRAVRPDRSDEVRRAVLRLLGSNRMLRLEEGARAIEATVDVGRDKGTAVRTIYEHAGGRGAALLYAGDNANDRAAFEMTARLGGVALGVGSRAPASARHRLRDPAELAHVLAHLAASVRAHPD